MWPLVSVHGPNDTDTITETLRYCVAVAENVVAKWDDRAESGAYTEHTSDECDHIASGAREVLDALRAIGKEPDDGRDPEGA